MRKNKLGYLGFLGLIGLLWISRPAAGNYWFLGFLGFFGFFGMLRGRGNDERIDRNINRACRNAFAFDTVVAAFSIAYVASSKAFNAMPLFVVLLSQVSWFLVFHIHTTIEKGSEDRYEDAD
jgi:hypothetical protein